MTHQWWGRNFVTEQCKVYGQCTLNFVPFISAEYLVRSYPRDELSYAMMASVSRGDDYILPILVGDVRVPPEMLHPHIGLPPRAADRHLSGGSGGGGGCYRSPVARMFVARTENRR